MSRSKPQTPYYSTSQSNAESEGELDLHLNTRQEDDGIQIIEDSEKDQMDNPGSRLDDPTKASSATLGTTDFR